MSAAKKTVGEFQRLFVASNTLVYSSFLFVYILRLHAPKLENEMDEDAIIAQTSTQQNPTESSRYW